MRGLERWNPIIDSYPPLTHEEEALLAQARDNGDEGAAEQLILHNLRDLVRKVDAKNWKDESEIEDLFMHAMEGMRKAALRWKPVHDKSKYKKPARFMHYAYWYVKDEINRFCKKFGYPMMSLDAPRGDGESTAHETFADAEQVIGSAEDSHDYMELDVITDLPKTQREIFNSRFLYRWNDSDEDLAWACRIKKENINKHLMKAILKVIKETGFAERIGIPTS